MKHTSRLSESGVPLWYGWFEAMHTRIDLLLTGLPEKEAEAAAEEAEKAVREMEQRFNRFDRKSDLWRINHLLSKGGEIAVDDALLAVFEEAEHYRQRTLGWFDVAIRTPGHTRLGETYRVDRLRGMLVPLRKGIVLDFGGYTKGDALRRVRDMLVAAGVQHGVISFGKSSVCCMGHHPQGKTWEIGLENPVKPEESLALFPLRECSLSTSGNNRRNKPGHILSAADGLPVEVPALISVVATSPLESEVLSTALFSALGWIDPAEILKNFHVQRVVEVRYGDETTLVEWSVARENKLPL